MLRKLCCLIMFAGLCVVRVGAAEEPGKQEKIQKFVDSLHFQTGTVAIPDAHASLALTPEFRFLNAADANRVLTQLWGNPPGSKALGMLVPTAAPLSDAQKSWAVVITYSSDGHISDADAATIDYDKMLKEMQQETIDNNAERTKQGYAAMELVGWAAKPHYDAAASKLYWAKELAFADSRVHTLNYDIRALGRGGYLSMNAVAGMDQLPMIEREMPNVLAMTQFDSGQRYADFNPSVDKVAAYGLGALVVGTLAAKAGLLAKLFGLLLVFKKVAIAGFVALAALARKIFGGKSATKALPPPSSDDR